jgi:hypothetical protein
MDGFNQIGKYLKKAGENSSLSLKRPVPPQVSSERIREVFDADHPVQAKFNTPPAGIRTTIDINFGQKLPSLECCGDCLCGITESYTSDSLVSGTIYVTQEYVPLSTIVYLDGLSVTRGVEYVEAGGKALSILVPFATIVISYVYTVGNCTESICVDERFECLDYTFLAGLTTVFADRFDRPTISDPSGGCGYYFLNSAGLNFPRLYPDIVDGTSSFSMGAWLGGVNKLIGKSVEVFAAVDTAQMSTGGQGNVFTLENAGDVSHPYSVRFNFIKTSTTVMTLRITGFIRAFTFEDDPFSNIDITGMLYDDFSVETTIAYTDGVRYWFRFAQINGAWVMKAWPQFTPEPSGAQLTMVLSDSYADVPAFSFETSRELVQPTVNDLLLNVGGLEAIQVGAALDNGNWGILGTGGGVGHYCAEVPDGLIRFGYNCFPANGVSTFTAANTAAPKLQWNISYPSLPNGPEGRLITLDETVGGINLVDGYPGGIRIKGQLVADVWENVAGNAISVQVKQYGSGALTMGGYNGVQGGSIVGTYLVPCNGVPVDVDIFLQGSTTDQYTQWGLHVENLQGFIESQAQYNGAFLSPNNTGNVVQFYYLRADGVQSANCLAQPFCEDCDTTRCHEVRDFFASNTATIDFSSPDASRISDNGTFIYVDKNTKSRLTFPSGTMKMDFNATNGFIDTQYASPFDCSSPDNSTLTFEANFGVKLGLPGAGEVGSFELGGWNSGPYLTTSWNSSGSLVALGSFNVTPTFNVLSMTTGSWYDVRFRIEGQTLFFKSWLSGTTQPDGWDFEGEITGSLNTFVFYVDSSSASNFNWTTEIRDLEITRVV